MNLKNGKSKMYIFYLLRDTEKPELYAYTDDRKLAKEFENFRDSSLFKKVKIYLTHKELMNLYQTYPQSELRVFETCMRDNKNSNTPINIMLVLTESEQLSIINEYDSLFFYKLPALAGKVCPDIFNDEIRKALHILDYDYHYYYYNEPDKIDLMYQYDYSMDGFALFYELFKNYIRKEP